MAQTVCTSFKDFYHCTRVIVYLSSSFYVLLGTQSITCVFGGFTRIDLFILSIFCYIHIPGKLIFPCKCVQMKSNLQWGFFKYKIHLSILNPSVLLLTLYSVYHLTRFVSILLQKFYNFIPFHYGLNSFNLLYCFPCNAL